MKVCVPLYWIKTKAGRVKDVKSITTFSPIDDPHRICFLCKAHVTAAYWEYKKISNKTQIIACTKCIALHLDETNIL